MPSAITALATTTLASPSATVTFSGIPGTYRDLRLITTVTSTTAAGGFLRLNGDTVGNYSSVWAYGSGGATGSSTFLGSYFNIQNMYSGNTGLDRWDFLDYSATDKHKIALNRNDSQGTGAYMQSGRWASTAAITSITLLAGSGNFSAGDTFCLYGVSA